MKKQIMPIAALVAMLTAGLVSCGTKQPTSTNPTTGTPTTMVTSTSTAETPKVVELKIKNEIKNYFIGESTQIEVEIKTSGKDANTSLEYKTSDATIATVSKEGFVKFLSAGSVKITVNSVLNPTVSDEITFVVAKKVPTEIKINKEFTSGRVGDEFELNYEVTPKECLNDVKVEISDTEIIEMKENKIKLLKEGSATISVISKDDATIKDELTIQVLKAAPLSITINNSETSYYVGTSFDLDYTILPSDADENVDITITPSDIATVEGTTVHIIKEGNATIKVASSANQDIYTTYEIQTIQPDFLMNKNGYTKNVDYSHMSDETDAYLQTNAVSNTDNPHAFAMFNAMGTRYYAEAYVSMIGSSDDGWARFGIGSATDDTDGNARAFFFSPKEGQKTVMMDVPNGWGAITAQSMIWKANGIDSMDPSNLKLAILRDGDQYYYLLNNKLYWYEINNKFHDVATYPTIITKDTQINITNWSVTLENAKIDEKLALPAMQQVFFNADTDNRVTYVSDKEFSISGGGFFQNASVKPLGDKALLTGNFAIEFDLSNVAADSANDNNTRIGVALRKVGIESPYVSDTFAMTNNGAQAFDYRSFSWNGGDHTYWQGQDSATRANGDTVEGHYKIVRTISEGSATLVLYFNDVEVLNIPTSYVGDYHPIFGANLASGKFTNVNFYGIK